MQLGAAKYISEYQYPIGVSHKHTYLLMVLGNSYRVIVRAPIISLRLKPEVIYRQLHRSYL